MIRKILVIAMMFLAFVSLEAKNIALLIGIGGYDTQTTGWSVIHGDNDVTFLDSKLKKKGFAVTSLTDRQATKANIVKALRSLQTSVSSGDTVYLHFSGHGQLVEDLNKDERSDYDQSFICYDACFSPRYKLSGVAYRGQNHLIDDELFPYLNEIKRKIGKKGIIVVVFDACYSGGAERGEISDEGDADSDVEWVNTVRGVDDEFKLNRVSMDYLKEHLKKPGPYSKDGGAITVISACESDKKNYECKDKRSGRRYGSLSYCIGKMLDSGVPMKQWGDYFRSGQYRAFKVFRPNQTPVVETY